MEPNQANEQDVYRTLDRLSKSVAKHMAAERATLTGLIDAQLMQSQKSLLVKVEAHLLEILPAAPLPSSELKSAPNNLKPKDIECSEDNEMVGTLVREDSGPVPARLDKSERRLERVRPRDLLTRLVGHPAFEGFFLGVILLNTVVACLHTQYLSFDLGERIKYPGVREGTETWSSGEDVFVFLEYLFAGLYTLEIVIKLAATQCDFWRSRWGVFDFTIVAIWYLNEATSFAKNVNPTILRLCRLVRLIRVVRHIGWFQALDSLHMLITAMVASVNVLMWSVLLLVSFFGLSALLTNAFMADYMEDPTGNPTKQRVVYKFFGSFSRAFISMFEMAFHNHAPIMRQIMENVDERWAAYFLVYKCLVGLSVMKVITGVFLHETFKICSEDDELMIIQKKRAIKTHTAKMTKLFQNLNDDGSSTLTWTEFEHVMKDEWVRMWLNAQGLDTSNAERLWFLLDVSGDGELTAEELVKGVAKLKGAATSIDMNHVVVALGKLEDQIRVFDDRLTSYAATILQEEELIEEEIRQSVSPKAAVEGDDPIRHERFPIATERSTADSI